MKMTQQEKNKAIDEYFKTKKGLVLRIYTSQKTVSKKREHPLPLYSREELQKWLFDQANFNKLYKKWEQSNYKKLLKPSVDRLDDSKGYSLSNIQLMTWGENKQKGHDDMRSGKLKHGTRPQKEVIQYSKDFKKINEFVSIKEASRRTKTNVGNISTCCHKIRKTAGGYIWRFKNG